MKRQTFRWQLTNDETGEVVADGIRFAWNAAMQAGQDALRDIPGCGMFERDGSAVRGTDTQGRHLLGDTYEQRWTGPRGTFTVEVLAGFEIRT